jgi:heptosyltransferase-2
MQFDVVITPHRHVSSGILARLTNAPARAAFDQHPLRAWFTHGTHHRFEAGLHETQRNHALLEPWLHGAELRPPRLYPATIESVPEEPFGVMAPASQWGTKQWPEDKWVDLCDSLSEQPGSILLLGGASDLELLNRIKDQSAHPAVTVCADFSLLESAALMKQAQWVISNDSGPLHLASAVDAATLAIFCSTTPDFGFGPMATRSAVVESTLSLSCKPCGLHGHRTCPQDHFKCGRDIQVNQVLEALALLN